MLRKTKYFILRRIFKYTLPLFSPFQTRVIECYAGKPEAAQPVFILGVPRAGTTLLYQLISNCFDVLYPDNLVFLCRENPFAGFWLSRKIYRDQPHNCFSSSRGKTMDCGLHAPNQHPFFWQKHFSRLALHDEQPDLLDQQEKQEIYRMVFSVINKYQKHLILKGAAVANNLPTFQDIFPDARLIFYSRNPLYTAQSLLAETRKMNWDFESAWMARIKPYNSREICESNSIHEKIVLFVYGLSKEIAGFRRGLDQAHYLTVSYEEICAGVLSSLNKIGKFLGQEPEIRKNAIIPELENSNKQKLDDHEFGRLKEEVGKLDWQGIM